MCKNMVQNKNVEEISIREQVKKFAIKSMAGFQTVMIYGLGTRLGIFDYLLEKAKSVVSDGKSSSISFTLKELSENLQLDTNYLDGWIHMALECGIFEIDENREKSAKTAPHVYDLLIDRNNMFYIGNLIAGFYSTTLFQDQLLENFKTGKTESFFELSSDFYKNGQKMSGALGKIVEGLFSKYCKDHKRILQKQGTLLEVGCGYGFNIENWAKKYKRARLVGIDVDPQGVAHAKNLIEKNNWTDRIEIIETTLDSFVHSTKSQFDIILLNQVLHEMNPDENYRKSVFEDIYTILKDDGMLIVGESMIPDTFSPKKGHQLFEIMHKWLEVGFGSRFYDEVSFKKLIDSSSFKSAELIKEGVNYFWAIKK